MVTVTAFLLASISKFQSILLKSPDGMLFLLFIVRVLFEISGEEK
uniref:Uncharacterized protein n=1 Tax=Setaria viridis TaxID=4556 RepID=A0A4U6TKS9_SETVI|nr:hypothetical protein SEVIR_7G000305v2 [Setaria viridis]